MAEPRRKPLFASISPNEEGAAPTPRVKYGRIAVANCEGIDNVDYLGSSVELTEFMPFSGID